MDGFDMDEFYIPHDLYGFSLPGFTSKLLWQLKPLDMCYNVWSNNIDHYLQMLIHDQPKYILGMGTYLGIDQDAIRIETIVKNQFRNDAIEKEFSISKKLLIRPFIKQVAQAKYASAIGNSWCNLVSWKIVRLIENKTLHSKYSFLHIPQSFSFKNSMNFIEAMIVSSVRLPLPGESKHIKDINIS